MASLYQAIIDPDLRYFTAANLCSATCEALGGLGERDGVVPELIRALVRALRHEVRPGERAGRRAKMGTCIEEIGRLGEFPRLRELSVALAAADRVHRHLVGAGHRSRTV